MSGIHSVVLCVRGEKSKKERSLFKKRERCIGWASRHVDVVCVKECKYMCMGGGTTVVV
jgi:hypothetical protein